ncbi:MAG TPA: phosphomannomutase/phosphoglucomutase, partial [Patescibacteria group bacterium]|nr:phosphomannomutase/phosphoglucomutase [Patescibacteria group bacterium]
MQFDPKIFKAYDVRAVYPAQLNEQVAYRIAQALVKYLSPAGKKLTLVLGRDVRESGPQLMEAFQNGLLDAGADVINIGLVSTDLFYYAVGNLDADGGVTVSASHNPREYNGFNMARRGAVPISLDSGLADIRDLALSQQEFVFAGPRGQVASRDLTDEFLTFVAGFADLTGLRPLKLVADANFGLQARLLQRLVEKFRLPVTIVPLNAEPDG